MKRTLARSRWETFRNWFNLGLIVIGFIIAFTLVREQVGYAFSPEGLRERPLPQLGFLALLEVLLLIVVWYRAVDNEMRMIQNYGEEFTPPPPPQTFVVGIGIAVVLGLMVLLSSIPWVFSALLSALKSLEILAGTFIRSKFKEWVESAFRESLPDDPRRPAWNILQHYYLRTPQRRLAMVELCIATLGLIMSGTGTALRANLPDAMAVRWMIATSYVSFNVVLVTNMVFYTRWQSARDRGLRKYEAVL